ncbi:hypothetical protein Pdw03_5468 [Penicillium digitatum]|uniref:Uncharacterized protein n=1 Tax=Penicillium digitatum TaxID=36651 RepID=A0A7T6XVB8_PENDI|nr:hypothetical protein Pdw03_5468 [Penicillium digitatum]
MYVLHDSTPVAVSTSTQVLDFSSLLHSKVYHLLAQGRNASSNRNPHWLPAMTWQGPICTPPAIERFVLHKFGPLDIPKQPAT